jgi:hypothetical protein
MQSQSSYRNNDHFMHAHYTALQILQGACRMFSASEPTLYYHIQGPKTFRSPIYAYCNHCNTNQPAEKMTILCMLTILLGKYCRVHAKCSRPRAQHYTTISSGRNHSGLTFMHTVTTAIPINLPKKWQFYACSLYCLANIPGVTPNVLGLGPNIIPPHSMTENIWDSYLCIL